MGRIIFITGTDTGVGKTLLTSLLLVHLRANNCHALAMKPFCSGGLRDPRILRKAQDDEITIESISPFQFPDPVAPLVAARRARRLIPLCTVQQRIHSLAAQCELLLVEGVGGLLVPLGEGYTVADLIASLRCPVLLVARNRLGAINHTLLTLEVLRRLHCPGIKIVFMDTGRADPATKTNLRLIRELATPAKVFCIPFLGRDLTASAKTRESAGRFKKTLARILGPAKFSAVLRGAGGTRVQKG